MRPVRGAVALRDERRLLHAPGVVDRDDDDDRQLLARRGFELHDVEAERAVAGDDARPGRRGAASFAPSAKGRPVPR